jgi:hypothetical protein
LFVGFIISLVGSLVMFFNPTKALSSVLAGEYERLLFLEHDNVSTN